MILSTPIPPREGVGFYVWNLALNLTDLGHQVGIVTRGGMGQKQKELLDGIWIWRPTFLPLYPLHVHLHGLFVNDLVNRLEKQFDLFHLHSPLPPPLNTSKPVLLTVHSPVHNDLKSLRITSPYDLLMKLQEPVSYKLENRLLETASMVSAVSPFVAEVLQNYPKGPEKVTVTWNGVDTNLFMPAQSIQKQDLTVLMVGRLAPGKGIEDLLRAFKIVVQRLNSVRLVIAGEGPLRQTFEKLILENNLEHHVRLIGQVTDRKQLVKLYQQASLFVLPSHREGLPTVVLEAMACGCPVIATETGGIPNLISSGENGLLVPPKKEEALAEAIYTLLQDSQQMNYFRCKARQDVEERFSWKYISKNFVDQYEGLVHFRGAPD